MTPQIDLQRVDTDGAIREAADAVSGDTRLSFLRKGAMGGAAALSGGAILGALVPGTALAATGRGRPPASFGAGDIGILNYALTLEYLERAFYTEASKNGLGRTNKQLAQIIRTTVHDEDAHVTFLKKGLGRHAVKQPKFDFGATVTDPAKFAATAYVLENTGVLAYTGQAFNIKAAEYLAAALSIVTVEARHAGAIGLYLGKPINFNGAFDKGATAKAILADVKSTGFIK